MLENTGLRHYGIEEKRDLSNGDEDDWKKIPHLFPTIIPVANVLYELTSHLEILYL